MSQSQSQPKLPEGYSRLEFTKLGKHKIELISDWVTPFGTIPAGFASNGASIPRPLWWFTHPMAELLEGSVLHDFHYDNAIKTKDFADTVFKQVVIDFKEFNNTAGWKIPVAYFFVRKFGRGEY